MPSDEYAQWVTSDIDFYALLGLQFESFSESELRRAYRKTALKYHPDKVGSAFDPQKYEEFQAANEVLGNADLKAKYDHARQARLQRQRANELFEGKRRSMKEDLEAREKSGSVAGQKRQRGDNQELGVEMRRLAEEGRKKRAARASMLAADVNPSMTSSPAGSAAAGMATPKTHTAAHQSTPTPTPTVDRSIPDPDDDIERLERKIREVEEAKIKRRAEKKARKSGVFTPLGSFATPKEKSTKHGDTFQGLRSVGTPVITPMKSPMVSTTPSSTDFAATMARLKAAQQQRETSKPSVS